MTKHAIPVFVPKSGKIYYENVDEDGFHLMYCKLYVYDCFQNEKCLFKGLGKVWLPRMTEGAEGAEGAAGAADDADKFFSPPDASPSRYEDDDEPPKCFRQVNSVYGGQLKRRFSGMHNFVDRQKTPETDPDTFAPTFSIPETDPALADYDGTDWNLPQATEEPSEFPSYQNVFEDNMEVENYISLIDSMDANLQPLDSLEAGNSNKGIAKKLDYEMLLPPSEAETGSYLTLQSAQGSQDAASNYGNIYEGLFDGCDDVQDHISIVNEEIDNKVNIEEYLYDDPDNFGKAAFDDNDESFLMNDAGNSSSVVSKERRDSYDRHSEVKCEICGRRCKTLNALNHHMLVHSEDRPFVCEICKKAFKEQPTLRRHMWTHMDKQHQCDICQKYFVEKSSLRRHISTIHADFKPGTKVVPSNPKQQFSCKRCGKLFKSQTKYNMHLEMHGNPNYECEVCGKVYAGRSHLRIHQRIHTGEKPFCCTICNMQFAFKHVLKSHQARIHQKIHKFKCNLCSLTFVKKSDLSSHASCHMFNLKKGKRHYGPRKTTKKHCSQEPKKNIQKNLVKYNFTSPTLPVNGLFGQLIDIPPETFDKLDTFEDIEGFDDKTDAVDDGKDDICKSPKSLTDQGKKKKECLECFKAFERMGDLKRHIISHIVENIAKKAKEQNNSVPLYECEICCNVVFKQVDKFKKHLREHAKLTLYQCDVCDRAFGDSSNFSKHKKVHGISFLKCSICSRKFNTKRMMVRHMEYHRHNKPKSCTYCKKLFHFESNLRKHIKIAHLSKGKMTYRCEECGDRFDSVKLKWEHQWEEHGMRKVAADCYICNAQFRKVSLLRAHLIKEHASVV